jgi:1,4-alpha-glucan branching enzyme
MFFMGEEIGAANPYTYDGFMQNREDLIGAAAGTGACLFRYYKDLIRLSVRNEAIRSRMIEVAFTDNDNRVIAFHRWNDRDEFLVVGNLSNAPFASGYWIYSSRIGNANWTEVFNSDSEAYGGWNVGNAGGTLQGSNGALNVVLPAAGLVIFHQSHVNA